MEALLWAALTLNRGSGRFILRLYCHLRGRKYVCFSETTVFPYIYSPAAPGDKTCHAPIRIYLVTLSFRDPHSEPRKPFRSQCFRADRR